MSISHITDKLILSSSPSQWRTSQASPGLSLSSAVDPSKDVLRSLFLSLSPPFSPNRTRDAIKYLQEDGQLVGEYAPRIMDDEEQALKDAVLGRLVAAIYAEALDTLLAEAIDSDIEAQWWADLERSRLRVAYHLVQTLPLRISNLFENVLNVLHSNGQPISFSVFKPSSIRGLLNRDTGRPISITAFMFPHLRTHPSVVPPPLAPLGEYLHSSYLLLSSTPPSNIVASACRSLWHAASLAARYILHYITLPLQLTGQEVHVKRLELERIRDERAEALGELASKHEHISRALRKDLGERAAFLQVIDQVLVGQQRVDAANWDALVTTSSSVLPIHRSLHKEDLRTYSLLRPSRLVRIWPRLLVLPPLSLYAIQRISASQDTLFSLANDAWETMKGFWRGWLVEPLADVAKTVRTGGEGSIIVQKGSINADLESLERMALSLASDKLNYSPTQLDDLSKKLRFGDLTPILQIYEEELSALPLHGLWITSALCLIQIQKAKVDVDQALAGIDKLLKSQELTFAFVGVAPALSLFIASSSGHVGGGRRQRTAAWLTMRRIERLLITQPRTRRQEHHHTHGAIPPLTTGLLLLSVSSLRRYAETRLPLRSRLREGFLEDVGREEKLRVVERMWRSWGQALGWERLAVEVSS
ncbi:ATP synthase regulation protein NCA2-domain-containing protein [Russula aff. rugulosa BPL654]|nr:ATP synthase regulation protein NCA2-domain-containing protein [Russula aff. rugulosa BPL654]